VQAASSSSSSAAYIQHTMHPLVEGKWAAPVFQNRFPDSESLFPSHWQDQFHISFLTLKNGTMQILGIAEFLKDNDFESFAPAWDKALGRMKASAIEKGNAIEVVDCSAEIVEKGELKM
jgi:hypothetical protein